MRVFTMHRVVGRADFRTFQKHRPAFQFGFCCGVGIFAFRSDHPTGDFTVADQIPDRTAIKPRHGINEGIGLADIRQVSQATIQKFDNLESFTSMKRQFILTPLRSLFHGLLKFNQDLIIKPIQKTLRGHHLLIVFVGCTSRSTGPQAGSDLHA